jgi:hypothetical protein
VIRRGIAIAIEADSLAGLDDISVIDDRSPNLRPTFNDYIPHEHRLFHCGARL